MNLIKTIYLVCIVVILSSCKNDNNNALSVSKSSIEIDEEGGSSYFEIITNAASWSIDNTTNWIDLSLTSGTESNAVVWVSVDTRSLEDRTGILTINAGSASSVTVAVTQDDSESLLFEVDKESLILGALDDTDTVFVTCDYSSWTFSSDVLWLRVSPTSGEAGQTALVLSVDNNENTNRRIANVVLTANDTHKITITVTQNAGYPNYNTDSIAPDMTGMSSDAMALASKLGTGLNIGNTLEAIGGENMWGNPNITESYVVAVKQLGFNAIRLPCSWDLYADQTTAKISETWLNRVKEVVGYCVSNDMYVLLNIHWDGGWLEKNCTKDQRNVVITKQKAYWQQIATTMRDFDEHLMFGSANEPNMNTESQLSVLFEYHQMFINSVRSTGGHNSYRVLVLQGESENLRLEEFPTDPIPNRLMYESHNYTPSLFTFMSEDQTWGDMFYYWGTGHHSDIEPSRNATWGEEGEHEEYFQELKTKYIDQGIPVLMGEYCADYRTTPQDMEAHNKSVDYWISFVTQKAISNGIVPFYWETGKIINRNTNAVISQRTIDAIFAGGQ